MVALLRSPLVCFLLLAAALAGPSRAADAGIHDPLVQQATVRMAASLAAGNYCAGLELKPYMDAALRDLRAAGADAGPIIAETIEIIAQVRYDPVPCDTSCPQPGPLPDLAADERADPPAAASHIAAIDAIVTRWLERAERDPPMLSIAVSRYSHDPLPRYQPGQPVDYLVHVGASCHGAVLTLDRDYELPGPFDGSGSFTPRRPGLWAIYIKRRDGLPVSPLTYLDARTGLPGYYKEFWVGDEPSIYLGPGGLGPWSR